MDRLVIRFEKIVVSCHEQHISRVLADMLRIAMLFAQHVDLRLFFGAVECHTPIFRDIE